MEKGKDRVVLPSAHRAEEVHLAVERTVWAELSHPADGRCTERSVRVCSCASQRRHSENNGNSRSNHLASRRRSRRHSSKDLRSPPISSRGRWMLQPMPGHWSVSVWCTLIPTRTGGKESLNSALATTGMNSVFSQPLWDLAQKRYRRAWF